MTLFRLFFLSVFVFAFLLLPSTLKAQQPIKLFLKEHLQEQDARLNYSYQLLLLALEKAEFNYRFVYANKEILEGRAIRLLQTGAIDILWTMTSTRREKDLFPVRIPIHKGIMGWRVALIQKGQENRFKNIYKDVLQQNLGGQGHDWPDTRILESNNFAIHTSTSYLSLFDMLQKGRIDYFPRSLAEVWIELERFSDKAITLDEHVMLHYPVASYFFVSRQNVELGKVIEKGLTTAIADGSFDKLFFEHHREFLDKANVKQRQIFNLENPYLSDASKQALEQHGLSLDFYLHN